MEVKKYKRNIGIAVVGDVLDINCWSNTPYFFYKTGLENSLFNDPWRLNMHAFNISRKLWNIRQLLLRRGVGGYQYSQPFLEKAEHQIPNQFFSSTVISFNQLFPRAASVNNAGGNIYYYIDTTLLDLFNEPAYGINVPDAIKQKALEQEKKNYQNATAIVSMGSWVHKSLIEYYQIPKEKIHQILPGANIYLPVDYKNRELKSGAGIDNNLVLGFIGKDWERKGLPILIQLKDTLRSKGYKISIKVIGNCPNELIGQEGIEFSGFIDKQFETERFIQEVSTCDIGCLFSSSEALGISVLEFLLLGIPVTGFFHQGLINTLLEGASIPFNVNASVTIIAKEIELYIQNIAMQRSLKEMAEKYSDFVTWNRCIREWEKLLNK